MNGDNKVVFVAQRDTFSYRGKEYANNEDGLYLLSVAVTEDIPPGATDAEVEEILAEMGIP